MALQKKSFSDIITFTRSSDATRYNASGLIELVPANTPRFDYDPVTKMARGILIEEARTNLLLRSEDFLSNWVNTGQFLAITPASSNGPRGANTMTKIARTDLAIRFTSQAFSIAVGATATASIYAKAAATGGFLSLRIQATYPNRIDAWFNLTTGECGFGLVGEMSGGSVRAENVGGGVWRCIVTATPATTSSNQIMFTPADAPGRQVDALPTVMSDVYVDAAQVETGSFATSYIPTTTSQVTRTTDSVKVNTLSPWYNPKEGTLFCEYTWGTSLVASGNRSVELAISSDSNNSALRIYEYHDGGRAVLSAGAGMGGDTLLRFLPTSQNLQNHKVAVAYTPTQIAASRDGSDVLSSAHTKLPVFDVMVIGARASSGQVLNGHVRAIRYYPRRLTDSEIKALTS